MRWIVERIRGGDNYENNNNEWIYEKKETEGLIIAAQDQALPTRWKRLT